MPMRLADALTAFAVTALVLHIVSQIVVAWRLLRRDARESPAPAAPEPVTILRPVSRLDPYLRETLESTFRLSWSATRILFCAARDDDPATAVVRELIAAHHGVDAALLIGDDRPTSNPKLNNCLKGWQAATSDLVALIDSNVLLPEDYVQQMLGAWSTACGMVTSPPLGAHPENFWADVECTFLNSHQARWQLLADELGLGFAQGKNLLFRKSILDSLGGLAALGREPAEDAAATKLLRGAGYHIALSPRPFPQPLARRSFRDIWARQVRWAKLRRATFLPLYVPELLCGAVAPSSALGVALLMDGQPVSACLALYLGLWFGSEALFSRAVGWADLPRAIFAMMARDLMLPCVWCAGFMGNSFEWQGHAMTARLDTSRLSRQTPS